MRALLLRNSNVVYETAVEKPTLTSIRNVLVKVHYAGICRTDIGIAKGTVPAKDNIILGHEFCGEIAGFLNGEEKMGALMVGDAVSANPMAFGCDGDTMCGKDCDGAFAEYIAVPSAALVVLPPRLLTPLGAFLEPVAAALAPLKYINGRTCIFGKSRIAELTYQVAKAMGYDHVERITHVSDFQDSTYDCIIETEPHHIDAYAAALRPGGLLVLKSRSFDASSFTANTIAMKELRIQGARYGDFQLASHLLSGDYQLGWWMTGDGCWWFGNVYDLAAFETAFAEAEQPDSKKTFFKICAE